MKKHFLLFLLLCLFTGVKAQEEYFNCEFLYSNLKDNGAYLGGEFKTYDLDGLTPTAKMQDAGFSVGTPWVVLRASVSDYNYFVGSTSLYEPEGTSNDWLVLPVPFKLVGKGCELSWKSMVFDNTDPEKRGGFKVMISTKGTEVEDFETKPLFSIDEEEAEWKEHKVNLDEYAGNTVYIAFVNNSTNKDPLGIDDIVITGPKAFAQFMPTAPVYTPDGEVTVGGRVLCAGTDPITALKISYDLDGQTYSKEYKNLNLQPGEVMDVAVDEKIALAQVGDHKAYKVYLEANDGNTFTIENYEVTRTAFKPTQRVLMEEPTGYWCTNCTQGLALVELLKEKYDDLFIPIAVHGDTYAKDRMTNEYYKDNLSAAIGNAYYPYGFVNRTYSSTPASVLNDSTYTSLLGRDGTGGFEYLVERAFNDGTYADIDLTAYYDDPYAKEVPPTLSFDITSKFAIDVPNANYRFAVALVENGVNNKLYKQKNMLSSFPDNWYLQTSKGLGEAGTFLGYETKPSVIPGLEMFYEDVARLIIGEFKGISNSINKSSIKANEEIKYTGEFDLGEFEQKIGVYNNVDVIAMLVEQETGKVVNSARFSLYDSAVSVETVKQDMGVHVYAANDECTVQVALDQPEKITIGIYGIDGKLVKTVSHEKVEGTHSFTIGGMTEQGIYLVKVMAGDKVVTKKVAL